LSTVIFKVAARVLVPLALVFGIYIYFKGHQTPGGGFVGGLVTAVGLIVHRMAYGADNLQRLLPCRERLLIAVGLAFALGTGVLALIAGTRLPALPFLTSNHGYLPLSLAGDGYKYEWATVMLFDAGVVLVVAGVVVGMIDALSRELETDAR
jgi:multisubunit Na+/H+ antiporter MnhB subunit